MPKILPIADKIAPAHKAPLLSPRRNKPMMKFMTPKMAAPLADTSPGKPNLNNPKERKFIVLAHVSDFVTDGEVKDQS